MISISLFAGVRASADEASSSSELKSILKDCYSSSVAGMDAGAKLVVNGHRLNQPETANVQWIKNCVVPFLPGSADERATLAARVAWWSLREGTLELSRENSFRYSLCHESGKDHSRTGSPLYRCGGNIWQVGIASGQVANYSDSLVASKVHEVIGQLSPHLKESDLIRWTASLAGYPEGSSTSGAILNSGGRVRRCWLIKNPLVGFLLVGPSEVAQECLRDHKSWCINGSYDEARKFGHSVGGMESSIHDLKKIFVE